MIIDEPVEQCAAPLSQATFYELRAVADAQTSPARRQLLNLQLDVQLAERDAHHAQVNGDPEAESKAIFARCKAKGELEEYYDELADAHNTGFLLAWRRTPQVIRPLIELALGIDWNKLRADIAKNSADIVELAEECVRLKGGAV